MRTGTFRLAVGVLSRGLAEVDVEVAGVDRGHRRARLALLDFDRSSYVGMQRGPAQMLESERTLE
jgi:hypothetical protein